jgi:hypothetical protein
MFAALYHLDRAAGVHAVVGLARSARLDLIALGGIDAGAVSINGDPGSRKTVPIGEAGGGLEIGLLGSWLALRLELRDMLFADPSAGQSGITHGVHAQAGLQIGLEVIEDRAETPGIERARAIERLEIGPRLGFSIADQYVDSRAIGGAATWHASDLFALELSGHSFSSGPSGVTASILEKYKLTPGLGPKAAKQTELVWNLGLAVRADVLRGAARLLGTGLGADLGLYFLAGGGIGGTRAPCTMVQGVDHTASGPGAACPQAQLSAPSSLVYEPSKLSALAQLGGGVHLGLNERLAASLELRDFIFGANRPLPSIAGSEDRESTAIRHILLASVGLALTL